MSFTLLVIDMQDYFSASHSERVQRACIREIKRAIREKATIIYVEYEGYGPTIPQLTDVTSSAKYRKAYHVIKDDDDGGQEVIDFLKEKHLPRLKLRVCGVNTDYCVLATTRSLQWRMPGSQITVVGDACNSNHNHKKGLSNLGFIPNTTVIRAKD